MIQPLHAILLGVLEGLTEFLPVSSTGHLILATHLLGLRGEAVKAFTVVIQIGALAAVAGLYRRRLAAVWRGLWGREAAGLALCVNLLVSFLPSAVVGLVFHRVIKALLFRPWPVVGALALGGVLMIGIDRWARHVRSSPKMVESVTLADAAVIGLAQCLSLWPGTSRAMVTIVAGLLRGLSPTAAAEYSFLLALPTLGAATLFDAAVGGRGLLAGMSGWSVAAGCLSAAVVAWMAMRSFLRYLARHGLALFGWYRLGLAAIFWLVAPRS